VAVLYEFGSFGRLLAINNVRNRNTRRKKDMKVSKALLVFLILVLPFASFLSAQSADQKENGKSVVNINTAGQADLERLPGIGPSLAKKILEFRQKNGSFKSPADLMAVQGIGEKKFEQLKALITVK
jgi:competence protein ComEA